MTGTTAIPDPPAAPTEPPASNVIEALARVIGDVGIVAKNKESAGTQKYKYRGIEDVLNALSAPLAKHRVVIIPRIIEESREPIQKGSSDNWHRTKITVLYDFYGPGGVTDTLPNPPRIVVDADDNSDKGYGKTLSYAFKAMALQVFAMATEDVAIDNEVVLREILETEVVINLATGEEIDDIVARVKEVPEPLQDELKAFLRASKISLRHKRGTTKQQLMTVEAWLQVREGTPDNHKDGAIPDDGANATGVRQ